MMYKKVEVEGEGVLEPLSKPFLSNVMAPQRSSRPRCIHLSGLMFLRTMLNE